MSAGRNVCLRKFWTVSDRPLPQVAEAFLTRGVVVAADHDYENVYEWLECRLPGGDVELNISRKHHHCDDGSEHDVDSETAAASEPLTFLLIGADLPAMAAMVDDLARRVGAALGLPVTIGRVDYLGGDEYCYVPE